jgi:TonB family protein
MRPHTVAPHEFAPLFDWTPPHNRNISLISFIAGSTILHALCFYVFQIIYPPTVALLPPPARVNVITPATEEGRQLLRWIEAEDPALSSTTQLPPEATTVELPKPAHVPSYVNRKPPLKEPPPYQPDLRVPSPQPPGPVPMSRPSPPAEHAIAATTLMFEGDGLGAPELPPLQFATSSKEPPQAARFRVAVSERGDVRHCFVESSSGDAALDAQARSYILRARFPAIENPSASKFENPLRWTTAIVEWGNDIAAPLSAPSPASPKP